MRSRPGPRSFLVVSTVLALALSAQPAPAQAPPAPSLRLIAAQNRLTLDRYGLRVYLDLGVWAAAVGGDFRLEVSRPDYESPVGIVQTDADGTVLRELPADLLDGWGGLDEFVGVTFRKASTGRYVAGGKFTFCPNSYDRQRADDTGSDVPTYPDSCGSSYFPFLKGTVWGIDGGWAVNALGGSEFDDYGIPALRVPEGRYQVTVRIDRRYVELLGIAPEDARVVLDVTVRDAEEPRRFTEPHGTGSTLTPEAAVPTVTDPDPSTLPDLAALPLWDMTISHRRRGDFLSFAASPWNAGPAPLVVEGFRRAGEDTMDAYQYFYDQDENVVGRAPVGTLEYHSGGGHNHWHFLQLVEFSLLDSSQTQVVLSKKQSFCIAPTDAVDLAVEGADYVPWSLRLSSRCGSTGSIWVREALAAGWADTYYQYVSGEAFNITNLPNGWYWVRLEMNPAGTLYDSSPGNEIADRRIHLGGRRGTRTLSVDPWHGIEA
jgi:Lysyl oxidase